MHFGLFLLQSKMRHKIKTILSALVICILSNIVTDTQAFFLNVNNPIPLSDEEDMGSGRIFYSNSTGLAAFAALSLFPLLFLAAAVGGSVLQYWFSHYSYNKCDEHYYNSGYNSGYGGSSYSHDDYGYGHGSGYGSHDYHRRSDDLYGYDSLKSFQKRSAMTNIELSGMSHNFPVHCSYFQMYVSVYILLMNCHCKL